MDFQPPLSHRLYHLLEFDCEDRQELIVLNNETYSIGRDPGNSIVLNCPSISRQHAILLRVVDADSNQHWFRLIDGNLKGKKSTNGVFINQQQQSSCLLRPGDEIRLGHRISATYHTFSSTEQLETEAAIQAAFMAAREHQHLDYATVIIPFPDASAPEHEDVSLLRLASFPELNPNPVVEIDFSGTITYLNPKAIAAFPDIREQSLQHPVLVDVLPTDSDLPKSQRVREIAYRDRYFEESIHYLAESELIRLYLFDITAKKTAEAARLAAERKYKAIFEHSAEGIFQTSLDGRYIIANPRLAELYGYASPAAMMAAIQHIDTQLYIDPKSRQAFIEQILETGYVFGFEAQVYRQDGEIIWVSENARAIYNDDGTCIGFEGSVQDITSRKRAEAELHKRDRLLEAVSRAAQCLLVNFELQAAVQSALEVIGAAVEVDCIFVAQVGETGQMTILSHHYGADRAPGLDIDRCWHQATGEALGITPWLQQLAAGDAIRAGAAGTGQHPIPATLTAHGMESVLLVPLQVSHAFWGLIGMVDSHGSRPWSAHEESTLFTLAANIGGAIHRQQVEASMRYRATHDGLTDLPNRRVFEERLALGLEQRQRSPASAPDTLAIMFLDLDRFKTINDTLGHRIGDRLLQQVAERLQQAVREGDTVARWGGDEFILLLPQVRSAAVVTAVAERILRALDQAFFIDGDELYISASIGIAFRQETDCSPESLIQQADIALYRMKEQGRNGYEIYDPILDAHTPEYLAIAKDLRHALEHNQFTVVYQPRINLRNGQIDGMEALVRWHHPQMGLISPAKFIPIAEENGLIIPIGEWVLRQACRQNKAWQDAGHGPIRVAVNLSPKQFHQPNLVQMIRGVLAETGLEARYLELEITETAAIDDIDFTGQLFTKLEAMGVELSIDDFGTGHSSLSRLQFLPLNHLKIDRSFVQDLTHNQKVAHIIATIVALGRSLGLSIVAEGVETLEQLEFLKSIDCETAQGYLFHRPIGVEEATQLLAEAPQPQVMMAANPSESRCPARE